MRVNEQPLALDYENGHPSCWQSAAVLGFLLHRQILNRGAVRCAQTAAVGGALLVK
jgi:hypothetical protein